MAEEGERREGKGFKVEDRRRFSPETGAPRETVEPALRQAQGPESIERVEATHGADEKKPFEESGGKTAPASEGLPEISFSAFVISLSTQALMHLGEIANPLSGKMEPDMPVAKQLIDIIGVLREKTRGNLDSGEEKLMEDVLFDLRMKYVEAVKKR